MLVSYDLVLNALIAGVLLGGFYAAVTVGISISFGILDIVNIAHPAFIILGSFIAYIVNTQFGLDPILTSILGTRVNKGRGGKGRYNLEKMDPEKFNAICVREAAGLIWNPAAEPGERCRTVNRLAEDIRDVLLQALEGSTTRSSGRGTGQRWWNKECGEAVAEHHSARRAWKRHKLANAVKKAKDGFYRNIITDLIEPKQLFQAVKWLKKRQRSNAPPP